MVPSSSRQPSISWATQKMLLTKAMLLTSQNCLPFSLFDAPVFQEYVETAIELGRAYKYQPIRSHHVKQHLNQVYEEVKVELRKRLTPSQELHLSIDSCTFLFEKNIFNTLISDAETDWHIGHAYFPKLQAKNAQAVLKTFLTAVDMIKKLNSDEQSHISSSSTPNPPPTNQSQSFWGQISAISMQSDSNNIYSATDTFFRNPISTLQSMALL